MKNILLFIATLCSVVLLNAIPSFADTLTFNEITNNSNRPFLEVTGPYNLVYVHQATDSEGHEINLTSDNLKPVHDGNTWIDYNYTGDLTTLTFKTNVYQKTGTDSYSQWTTPAIWNGLSYTVNLYTSSGMLTPNRSNMTIYKKDDTVFFYRLMNLAEVVPEVQTEEKLRVEKIIHSSARSLVLCGIGLLALLIFLVILPRVFYKFL